MQVRRELPVGALALYVLTAALEAPVIVARYAAVYVMAAIALKATGNPSTDAAEWAKLAVLPTLWSAAALASPAGGGWWWQQKLGGRRPSLREYAAYRAAMETLQAGTTIPLPQPKRWFVVDESTPDAAVCGDALMLTRGLLEGPDLPAALAHQLGHMQGMDARLTAALDRLVLSGGTQPRANVEKAAQAGLETQRPGGSERSGRAANPAPRVTLVNSKLENAEVTWKLTRWATRMTIALLRGGLALRLTSIGWGEVWREAEYEADRFAAAIGWGSELADFLEAEALKHDHPIPLVWLSDHTHPPTELRVDALRALAQQEPAQVQQQQQAQKRQQAPHAESPRGAGQPNAVRLEREA